MKKFKGIIFDIDGTLTSTNELIFETFNHVAKKYSNRTYTFEELTKLFGPTEDVILKEKFGADNELAIYDDYYKFYEENHPTMADLYPGIEDLLKYVKSKNIITSIFTGKGKRATNITLEILNIKKYFDLIVTGDDVASHKPSAEGIFKFLNLFKLRADEVLMIGDSIHDIIASKEAGVHIASAVWDSYSKPKVIEMNPQCYFESVNELREWLMDKI